MTAPPTASSTSSKPTVNRHNLYLSFDLSIVYVYHIYLKSLLGFLKWKRRLWIVMLCVNDNNYVDFLKKHCFFICNLLSSSTPLRKVNNNFFTHQWSLDKDDSTPLNQPVFPQQLAGIVMCHSRSDNFVKSWFRKVDDRGPASIAAQTSTIDDARQFVPEVLELADLDRARLVADVCTCQSNRTAKTLYQGTYEIVIRNANANITWNKHKFKD